MKEFTVAELNENLLQVYIKRCESEVPLLSGTFPKTWLWGIKYDTCCWFIQEYVILKRKDNIEYQFKLKKIDEVPWPYWQENRRRQLGL